MPHSNAADLPEVGSALFIPENVRSALLAAAHQRFPDHFAGESPPVPPRFVHVTHRYEGTEEAYEHLLPGSYGGVTYLVHGCILDIKSNVGMGYLEHPEIITRNHFRQEPCYMGNLSNEGGSHLAAFVITQREQVLNPAAKLQPILGAGEYDPKKVVQMGEALHAYTWVLPIEKKRVARRYYVTVVLSGFDIAHVVAGLGSGEDITITVEPGGRRKPYIFTQ